MKRAILSTMMLGLALLLGAAQGGGSSGSAPRPTRVEDLPPEIRAMLPPGAVLSGPPVSDGLAVFDTPQRVGAPVLAESVPAAADAIIASETLRLAALHFQLADPIVVGPPFNVRYPAGTDVPRLVQDGAIRHCIRQRGTYTPPEDEHGEIYPGLCLEDRDGDGRFETAILKPYHPERVRDRAMPISPVRLAPNPSAMEEDRDAVRLTRRLRVAHVGADGVLVLAEQGAIPARQAEATAFAGRPEESVTLPLRDGANAALGGIQLRLLRDGDGWRIAASGALAPWMEVREDGNLIIAGGLELRRRPSL